MKCLYCSQIFTYVLSLQEILSFSFLLPNQLCPKCRQLFLPIAGHQYCSLCQKISTDKICSDCRQWQQKYPNYSFQHQAIFQYNDAMHDWFSLYKFKGHRQLSGCFARELQQALHKQKKKAVIIPIPLSKERLKERGFNQVEELLKQAGFSYFPILKKQQKADSTPQSSKTKQQRLKTKQPFYLPKKYEHLCTGKELLLFDDIYTTGQTLFHAAACFHALQPKQIHTFSLAR